MLNCGCWAWVNEVDCDYSEWLGPDYKEKYKQNITAPIMICNHITHLDAVFVYIWKNQPTFSADAVFKTFFPMNYFSNLQDFVWLPRDGNQASRDAVMSVLRERYDLIE